MVRFWLTAGRGGFGLSDSECPDSSLYAIASSEPQRLDRLAGWTACVSPIPPQHPSMAVIKSNNYLPNVLAKIEAEHRGFDVVSMILADAYHL